MKLFFEWLTLVLLGGFALFLAVPLFMQISVAKLLYPSSDTVPKTDVAIVLGASVVRGKPSPVLAARANEAIDLYQKGKVKKILVTGDSGALTHDEVTPVRKYLLAAGIPAGDIFLDHAGFDTYSSMYRAHAIFQATSATVVTQKYHLPRALFIAERVGLSAVGVSAVGGEKSLNAFLREIPASWKALLDVLTNRQPKYLGKPIPLSGSGESTWY